MSRTVLVVDDAAFIRRLIRTILSGEGYQVHEAVNGRDAVEKYAELHPDLVTMDVNMPGMSGIDAMREILVQDPAARVVIVSAVRSAETLDQARAAGALDVVPKPFRRANVLDAVRTGLLPTS